MKILFIAPRFPYPLHKGDQLTVYRRLIEVSKRHEVTLLSFFDEDIQEGLDKIKPYCKGGIYTIPHHWYFSFLSAGFHALISFMPLQVLLFQSGKFRSMLKKILTEQRIDLVHIFLLRMAPYRNFVKDIPCIIDLVDSMSLNIERRMRFEKGVKKLIFGEELRRLQRYEKIVGSQFSQMILTAEKDKAYFGTENITLIPSTVSVKEFYPIWGKHCARRIAFSGNLSYAPNIHAVLWFVEKVYPILVSRNIDFEFVIIGKNPAADILRAAKGKEHIRLTGYVESMNEALNSVGIAVAPMQSGSGMQGKILEAMACGLPVVATTIGKGSIQADESQGLYRADEPEKFAEAIIELLQDKKKINLLGKNAQVFINKEHDTDKTLDVLEGIYQKIKS